MNSAYIINGDEHVYVSGKLIKHVTYLPKVDVWHISTWGSSRWNSRDVKMQIVLNGEILFDNTI